MNFKFLMQKFLETDQEGLLVLVMSSEVNKCIVLQWLNYLLIICEIPTIRESFGVCLIVSVSQYSHHTFSVYIGGVSSVFKIHMPGNNPKERIQHSEQGKSLKSRMTVLLD
jgi:hypothetical protein